MEGLDSRLAEFLGSLAQMASGDLDHRVPLSNRRDSLDAIAHGINVLVGEIQLLTEELRHAKERAESANVAKSFFLQNISHEIRTPLTVILGSAELLSLGRLSPDQVAEFHQRIRTNGRALTGILDDLHELARIESDRLAFDVQAVCLREVVADVIVSFEHQAASKNVRLSVENEVLDPLAMADTKRVRQILVNVIGNAVKFTQRGGAVAVRLERSGDGRRVIVDVADSGIGLFPDQADSLFEPFVQADPSIAKRFGGSGLGLALSRRLAEKMDGALYILDCEPEVGATFRLELPAAAIGRELLDLDEDRVAWTGDELRGLRVLLVEDEDDVRAVNSELLRSVGASVIEASDGGEAIELARRETFDVVLMDIRMPYVDGLEATRSLRARGFTTPIVALSAYLAAEQESACIEAGCTHYLAKPVDLDRLIEILRPWAVTRRGRRRCTS